jgi:hypothetical protein
MMKKAVYIFLIFLLPLITLGQNDTAFHYLKTIKGDVVGFTVDNLDNVYIFNSRNQLKKLNANGDSVAVYNQISKLGKATQIDASNPLRVLLYYKDFATIVVLDRFLNVRNTIDLRKHNIFQVRAISQSYDNNIWLFDEMDNKLKKIDEKGNLLMETPDFRLILSQSFSPTQIFDQNQYVYLYDPQKGIYVFDYYGSLNNGIQILNWENFKISGNLIYGSKADTLYRYDIKEFLYDEWKLPAPLTIGNNFNFTSTRLYAIKNEELFIYSFH